MRIFFCGLILMTAAALFIIAVMPDTVEEYSDTWDRVIWAAFICGALSQAIKQYKGEDK